MPDPPPIVVRTLRRALLAWYGRHQRKLPWRASGEATPDPYRVLVSEAMLQQTQVATVVDYFTRFTSRFPTVQSLADADEQEVLRAWQGLGYYRRARNLLRAARQIVAQHSGRVPDNVDQLQGLPGVGRYTAGAVASIAYHQPAPILDGNVARVLSRLYAIEQPIDQPRTRDRLWSLAQALVPRTRPGDFNQALMELGGFGLSAALAAVRLVSVDQVLPCEKTRADGPVARQASPPPAKTSGPPRPSHRTPWTVPVPATRRHRAVGGDLADAHG